MPKLKIVICIGTDATVVVTNELKADEKATFNPHDGVIYINNKADLTDEDVAKAVALHEVSHITEGTKSYARLVKQIEAVVNDKNAPESVKKIVGDFTKRQMSASSAYESEMEPLNLAQTKYLVDTEVNADLIGDLLSDDYFIDKLAERDESLLKKLYNSFKNRATAKKSELGPDGIKYLKKLASKFGKAIDKRAGGVKLSQLGGDEKKEVETVDDVRYNKDRSKAKLARYIPYDKIGKANVEAIRRKLQSLYAGTDNTVADGIAIVHKNKVYIVDSGKENGQITFGVRKRFTVSNEQIRKRRVEKINAESKSKGFISRELFGKIGNQSNNYNGSSNGRESGEELSVDNGEPQNNQTGIFEDNGDRGRGVSSDERKSKNRSYEDYSKPVTEDDVKILRSIERKSINEFSSDDIVKAQKWAYKFYQDIGTKSPFFRAWFGDWRAYDKKTKIRFVPLNTRKISAQDVPRKETINEDTGWKINISGKGIDKTSQVNGKWSIAFHSLKNVNEMLSKAILLDTTVIDKPSKKVGDSAVFMHNFYCPVSVLESKGVAKLYVIESHTDTKTFYLTKIEMVSTESREATKKASSQFSSIDTDMSIAQIFEFVKLHDKSYEANSKNPIYFMPKPVNNLLVNENGTPKVVYHGTNAKFTVFDYDKTKLGKLGYGFYFTSNKNFAKNYSVDEHLVEAYITMKNPLVIEKTSLTEKQIDFMLENLSEFELKAENKNIQELKEEILNQETSISRNFKFLEIASKYQDVLDNMGSVIGFDGIINQNWDEYVVFEPSQIKSATDNIGTFDRDNPDIRYSKNRLYDPKNDKDFTFEEVPGGIKVNFNDFDTTKSNDNSNDLEVAERARKDSMDALLNSEPPKKEAVIIDNSLLRRVTNNTKAKKFTRKDVKNIVDELLSQDGYFGDNFVHLKGKQRAEAERMLWQELNTKREGELGSTALDIADYIIRNTIATEYLEVTEDVQLAAQFVDAIKPYLHNMNLEAIKGDIKAKFDDNNSPYLMWAVRKNSDFRGYTADEVKQELEALGLGFAFEKTSEADIFFEIDNLYKLAKQVIIDATPSKQTLLTAIGTDEAKKLKQKLAKDIVDAHYTKGTETSFYKLQQKYIDKIAKLGNEVKQAHRRNTLNNRILKEAKKISDSNKHTFANATEAQTDALKNIKSLLSRINSREQVNRTSMRAIMKELSLWYNQENPVLGYIDEQHPGFFSKQIAELTRYFGEVDSTGQTTKKEKPLSIDELELVNVILHHMNHIFENYGKIWRGGKYVEAADVVKTHYEVLEDAEKNVPSFERMFLQNKYVRYFMDPMSVLATWDGHDPNGYFTTTYKDLVEGLINQRYDEMQALKEFDEFRNDKKNKAYMKALTNGKDKIKIGGRIDPRKGTIEEIEIPKYIAMDLYMVSKTGQAIETLEETGYCIKLDGEHTQERMICLVTVY